MALVTNMTCHTCRRLKCKCVAVEGGEACQACSIRGIDCVYPEAKKRGPKFKIGAENHLLGSEVDQTLASTADTASKRPRQNEDFVYGAFSSSELGVSISVQLREVRWWKLMLLYGSTIFPVTCKQQA